MTRTLTTFYQLASWCCTGFAWANGAILFWDGSMNVQSRVVTFAVAMLFVVIGVIVLGVERSLSRVYRYSNKTSGELTESQSARAWTFLYLFLTSAVLLILVTMGSGLFAIISRLQQGFHIFG